MIDNTLVHSRLGIFVCYDKQGIIDDYVCFMLDDLCKNLNRLVIVFNGKLSVAGKEKLLKFTSEIIERDNSGFDAVAWKSAMTEYLGWDEVRKYDELLLINDSFYGPFSSFCTVFNEMEKHNLDFWGLTMHERDDHSSLKTKYGYIPAHIETYFTVINARMLKSDDFSDYWNRLPDIKTFSDAVSKNEVVFTKHFEDLCYTWDVYSRNPDSDNVQPYVPYIYTPVELLESGFPIVKRKLFVNKLSSALCETQNEGARNTLEWIRNNTSYDTSLIFTNLLRTYNISDIYEGTNLNYIIDENQDDFSKLSFNKRVLVIFNLCSITKVGLLSSYLANIPKCFDILVTTNSSVISEEIIKEISIPSSNLIDIIVDDNCKIDAFSLLILSKKYIDNYDYICFCHDFSCKLKSYPYEKSFEDIILKNLLPSESFIYNIIVTFEDNPCLGLLLPPIPVKPNLALSLNWGTCFERTQSLLRELGISVPMDKKKACFSIGNAFWFKRDSLATLFEYNWLCEQALLELISGNENTISAIERSFPYIAQSRGYYSGVCMTKDYATILLNNFRYSFLYNLAIEKQIGIDRMGKTIGIKNTLKILFVAIKEFLNKL